MFLFLVFMLGFINILQFLSWLYLGFLASLLARSKVTVKTFCYKRLVSYKCCFTTNYSSKNSESISQI